MALALLDLSAAFDTIDHHILLDSLKNWFGIQGSALGWIESYLSNHTQQIKMGPSLSDKFDRPFGVPKGSVLGPLLFTLYTSQLSHVISGFGVTHHLYADDTQIYVSFESEDFDLSFDVITSCLNSGQVQDWMNGVRLKLNPDKPSSSLLGKNIAVIP